MQSKVDLVLEDGIEITIKVAEPVLDPVGGFTTYLITGTDKIGSFQIRRRFNQFYLVRDGLSRGWPGCYIPPVPDKKIIGNKQDKVIQQRRRFLEYFCLKMAGIKYLFYSQLFQQFLRNKSVLLESAVDIIANRPSAELVNTYRTLFGTFLQKSNPNDLRGITTNFYIYLKKAQKQLGSLQEEIKQIADASKVFNDNLNVLNSIMMPQYEKNVLVEYVNQQQNNLLFANDNQVNVQIRALRDVTVTNPYDYLVDLISFELKQVEAMKEAIENRQNFEQKKKKLEEKRTDNKSELTKLTAGKSTFKSFFSRGSKQEQIAILEKSLVEDQKQIENMTIIIDFTVIVLGLIEIEKFKSYKKAQYYQIINKVSKLQLQHMSTYGAMMKGLVVAHQNIKYE